VGTDRGPRSNPPCARPFPSVFNALQNVVSALLPTATAKADMPQMVMSALLLKADMCSARDDVS
jgi:hypothetical protein